MLTLALSAAAQSESGKKFEYRIKAGFNIGGTLPIPLPAEIRKIESYSPTMAARSRKRSALVHAEMGAHYRPALRNQRHECRSQG